MPDITIGQQVIRLIPSTTGRQISPNLLGVIGGLNPAGHDNRPDMWPEYGYMPVQWVNGLWSSMAIMDKGYSWDFYPQLNAGEDQAPAETTESQWNF